MGITYYDAPVRLSHCLHWCVTQHGVSRLWACWYSVVGFSNLWQTNIAMCMYTWISIYRRRVNWLKLVYYDIYRPHHSVLNQHNIIIDDWCLSDVNLITADFSCLSTPVVMICFDKKGKCISLVYQSRWCMLLSMSNIFVWNIACRACGLKWVNKLFLFYSYSCCNSPSVTDEHLGNTGNQTFKKPDISIQRRY